MPPYFRWNRCPGADLRHGNHAARRLLHECPTRPSVFPSSSAAFLPMWARSTVRRSRCVKYAIVHETLTLGPGGASQPRCT